MKTKQKSPIVKTDQVYEAMAKKLSGIGRVPLPEQSKMIKRAIKAGIKEMKKNVSVLAPCEQKHLAQRPNALYEFEVIEGRIKCNQIVTFGD